MLLARLAEHGADIDSLARADEVRRPVEDQREAHALGGRNRLLRLMREMPELAADLDVTGARLGARADAAGADSTSTTGSLSVGYAHHLAAPDIDAVGFQRAVRLLHARG